MRNILVGRYFHFEIEQQEIKKNIVQRTMISDSSETQTVRRRVLLN